MPNFQNNETIVWEASEFRHYEKNYAWYVTWAAASLLVIGYFAIQKDFFAAISLAIMALCVYFFAKQTPEVVTIALTPKGIQFGNIIFPYKQIHHFWVVNKQNYRTLNFHTTAALNNIVVLELEEQNPDEIRDYLLRHLPEHTETEETFAQRVMHKLKF